MRSEYPVRALNVFPVDYFPLSAWKNHENLKTFYNHTGHRTTAPGATVNFTFVGVSWDLTNPVHLQTFELAGSFVAYFSDLDRDHGDYFVSVDGRPVAAKSSYAPRALPTIALFTISLDHLASIQKSEPMVVYLPYMTPSTPPRLPPDERVSPSTPTISLSPWARAVLPSGYTISESDLCQA